MSDVKKYRLVGPDGRLHGSAVPGSLGGNRRARIYGRLDCPSARRALARGGGYAPHRVFFADEATAIKAGYRPCWLCCRPQYIVWKRGLAVGDRKVR